MSWGWFDQVAKAHVADQIREAEGARLARISKAAGPRAAGWRSGLLAFAGGLDTVARNIARASAALTDVASQSGPSTARGRR